MYRIFLASSSSRPFHSCFLLYPHLRSPQSVAFPTGKTTSYWYRSKLSVTKNHHIFPIILLKFVLFQSKARLNYEVVGTVAVWHRNECSWLYLQCCIAAVIRSWFWRRCYLLVYFIYIAASCLYAFGLYSVNYSLTLHGDADAESFTCNCRTNEVC